MPTEVDQRTLNWVLSAYELRHPLLITRVEASTRNDNFLVHTANQARFVLRRNRRVADEARVRFQLRFQQHLLDSGFPTSRIMTSASGDTLVTDDDGGLWALFTYIEGDEYDFSRVVQVEEAARRLAQFHSISDSFPDDNIVFKANR